MMHILMLLAIRHQSINVKSSTFRNINIHNSCHVNGTHVTDGEALSFDSCGEIWVSSSTFRNTNTESSFNGGAIYLYNTGNATISIFDNSFINLSVGEEGGAIYIFSLDSGGFVDMAKNEYYNCSAYKGGCLYIDYTSGVNITEDIFSCSNCTTTGGSIDILKRQGDFYIGNCCFDQSEAEKKGGAIFMEILGIISLHSNSFKNCNSDSGAAICFSYPYVVIISEFSFTDNIFENCKCSSYGAVLIESGTVKSAVFVNNNFTNCISINHDGVGGGFLARTTYYYDIQFTSCHFTSCYASSKYGALGVEIEGYFGFISNITLSWCTFENCSSSKGSCIGTQTPEFSENSLVIEGKDESYSVFRSLFGINDDYVIFTDVSTVKIGKTIFDKINTGIIHSIDRLKMIDCHFTNCSSTNSLINCTGLTGLVIQTMMFTNCNNLFLVESSGFCNISSLAINDSGNSSSSYIEGKDVNIKDLNLTNFDEQINFITNGNASIVTGRITNSSHIITITGNLSAKSYFNADMVIFDNSCMFEIKQIEYSYIHSCNVSYISEEKDKEVNLIYSESSYIDINFCTFSAYNVTMIKLGQECKTGLIDRCIFKGHDSQIYVTNDLTLKYCEFYLCGNVFLGSGKIIIDRNCFLNKYFGEFFGGLEVTQFGTVIFEFDMYSQFCIPPANLDKCPPPQTKAIEVIEGTFINRDQQTTDQEHEKATTESEQSHASSVALDNEDSSLSAIALFNSEINEENNENIGERSSDERQNINDLTDTLIHVIKSEDVKKSIDIAQSDIDIKIPNDSTSLENTNNEKEGIQTTNEPSFNSIEQTDFTQTNDNRKIFKFSSENNFNQATYQQARITRQITQSAQETIGIAISSQTNEKVNVRSITVSKSFAQDKNAETTQDQKNTELKTSDPTEEASHVNQNVMHATIDSKIVETSKEQQSNDPDQNSEKMTKTKQFDEAPPEVNVAKEKKIENPGVIAGILVGVILLLIILIIIIIFLIKNRDSSYESANEIVDSEIKLGVNRSEEQDSNTL